MQSIWLAQALQVYTHVINLQLGNKNKLDKSTILSIIQDKEDNYILFPIYAPAMYAIIFGWFICVPSDVVVN